MKIGLLSDIHANLPALEAVLDDMPDVDRIVCAGDVIGYNLWPAECLEIIRETADITVMGNHDRTVETPHQFSANRMAEAGLEHAKRELTNEQLDWLGTLLVKPALLTIDSCWYTTIPVFRINTYTLQNFQIYGGISMISMAPFSDTPTFNTRR